MLLSAGLIMGGFAPFNIFPKTDYRMIEATVEFPDGTPQSITDAATVHIHKAFDDLNQEYQKKHGNSLIKLTAEMWSLVPGMNPVPNWGGQLKAAISARSASKSWRRKSGQSEVKKSSNSGGTRW